MFSSGHLLTKIKKARILGLMLILIQYYTGAYSQTQISGRIKDTKGHPIPGASISVKGSFDGATSDSSGIYSFSSTDTGLQTLKVSSVGYRAIEVTFQIMGKFVKMDLQLKEEPNELKAVTISAGSFAAGDKTRGAVMSSWILPLQPALMPI